jgi:aspartate carbamoyltransferase catalytic subunit
MPRSIIETLTASGMTIHEASDLNEVLGESDVIYWTRVQEERFSERAEYDAIADRYVMTPGLLARARPGAILMHPLPRKHEMGTPADHAILDADPRSVYFHQMQNGMYVRMALVAGVLGATV